MRRSLFIILFILCYLSGYSFFEKDIRVLTMQNGLADNTVSCIHKDRDGFMWFGTNNGLSRYDGKNIRNFGLDERYMKVNQIRESENNLLWLIADEQIYCFDRRMEQYIPVHLNGKYTGVQDILSTFYLRHLQERGHHLPHKRYNLYFRQMKLNHAGLYLLDIQQLVHQGR